MRVAVGGCLAEKNCLSEKKREIPAAREGGDFGRR
jgi:hypothetical protein